MATALFLPVAWEIYLSKNVCLVLFGADLKENGAFECDCAVQLHDKLIQVYATSTKV